MLSPRFLGLDGFESADRLVAGASWLLVDGDAEYPPVAGAKKRPVRVPRTVQVPVALRVVLFMVICFRLLWCLSAHGWDELDGNYLGA